MTPPTFSQEPVLSEPKTAEVKVVPCSPAEAMIDAGYATDVLLCRSDALTVWSAMLAASPPAEAGEGEDLAGKLTAIRDKFLIPTPDKGFTDYAIITRCIVALSAQPVSPSEGEAELVAIQREQLVSCSPEWLTAHPGQCSEAPRVASRTWDGHSHYHPANWPTHPASDQSDTERMRGHASDCSVHNEPAYRNGPCDCGGPEWSVEFEPMDTLPRDDTILVAVKSVAKPEKTPTVYPAYVDESGVLCDSGTWRPDKGLNGSHFNAVGWKRLPSFRVAALAEKAADQ